MMFMIKPEQFSAGRYRQYMQRIKDEASYAQDTQGILDRIEALFSGDTLSNRRALAEKALAAFLVVKPQFLEGNIFCETVLHRDLERRANWIYEATGRTDQRDNWFAAQVPLALSAYQFWCSNKVQIEQLIDPNLPS